MAAKKNREKIIEGLTTLYAMELETTENYIANSVMLDGVRAEEIKKSLAVDIAAELGHAQQLALRIKQLHGRVPGSLKLPRTQKALQPSKDTTDVVYVIKGVMGAEEAAIEQYNKIIRLCDGEDYVTQDLLITLLGQEEAHFIEFEGFLKEYTK